MSREGKHCKTCAQPMPANSPAGLCPACLITRTLDPLTEDAPAAGPYRLLEKIGEGAYGEVFIGEQSQPIQREAAVKLLKIDHLDSTAAQRFQAEAQALALLDHPNIARLYEAGTTGEGRPYLALELVPGASLTAWCETGSLDTESRLTLFRRVCDAMEHAHQRGLIHRDLKPENILVDPACGEPKVIDFGIARSTSTLLHDSAMLTGAHDILGTPAFLSPEQTDGGKAVIDARSDVYALGAVLYELLTGKNVIEASGSPDSHFEILRTIREVDPPPASSLNPNIPPHAERAISKAMAKRPQDRFDSVAGFSTALDVATPFLSPSPPPKTSRRLALAFIALVLAVLTGVTIFKPPSSGSHDVPPPEKNSTLNGFHPPFTLVESGFHKPPTDFDRIKPFSPQSSFCWFVYRDERGDEFTFGFDNFHRSSSMGEFLFGAKGADLPGARHVEPGTPEDRTLWELLTNEKSATEFERLEKLEWDEIGDLQTSADKTFVGQIYLLRTRRSAREGEGSWPAK